MTIHDIRPPADRTALGQRLAAGLPELGRGQVWRHRRKDGAIRDVEVSSQAIAFGGRPARLVLATDGTDAGRRKPPENA